MATYKTVASIPRNTACSIANRSQYYAPRNLNNFNKITRYGINKDAWYRYKWLLWCLNVAVLYFKTASNSGFLYLESIVTPTRAAQTEG
jgi:hypothetical protein